jgi:hypothetical protein
MLTRNLAGINERFIQHSIVVCIFESMATGCTDSHERAPLCSFNAFHARQRGLVAEQ